MQFKIFSHMMQIKLNRQKDKKMFIILLKILYFCINIILFIIRQKKRLKYLVVRLGAQKIFRLSSDNSIKDN